MLLTIMFTIHAFMVSDHVILTPLLLSIGINISFISSNNFNNLFHDVVTVFQRKIGDDRLGQAKRQRYHRPIQGWDEKLNKVLHSVSAYIITHA